MMNKKMALCLNPLPNFWEVLGKSLKVRLHQSTVALSQSELRRAFACLPRKCNAHDFLSSQFGYD